MTRRWMKTALAAVALALTAAACDDGPSGIDDGRLTILLTDEAGDVEKAVVRIDSIYLQGGGEDDEDEGAGRVVLRNDPVTTDLLTLVDDVATLVDDAALPAGTYAQLRFVINDVCIVGEAQDGESGVYATSDFEECGEADGSLTCPSCPQTGIKVVLPEGGLTVTEEEQELLVDFDVEESFGPGVAGESGVWVMTPVVRATEPEPAASGS